MSSLLVLHFRASILQQQQQTLSPNTSEARILTAQTQGCDDRKEARCCRAN